MVKYHLTDLFEGNFPMTQGFGNNPTWAQLGITPPPGVPPTSKYYAYYGLAGHEGTDWGCPIGTWLNVPFEKGQILRTGYDPAYGYYIVIWDSVQLCAVWYCHMSSINVTPGQVLSRGTRVGKTGQSGSAKGAHLHCNFVETDANANRLNVNNGFKGNENILDPNLVSFGLPPEVLPTTDADIIKYLKDKVVSGLLDSDLRALVRKVLKV